MLARSRKLLHPSGATIRTPLLVPSFSSKGLRYGHDGRSELRDVFSNTASVLTESMLISAYDVHHGHLPKPNRFPCTPTLTFVDSGGYETGPDYDFSAIYRFGHKAKAWTRTHLRSVLDAWPAHIDAVFVSFDKETAGRPIRAQIDAARKMFRRYPKQLHNFLLKPTRKSKGFLQPALEEISANAKHLVAFQIIGVTEKELGRSPLERMITLAKLRQIFDREGIMAPIQVFGALDPLTSCLYFLAGGEIFDGLTWLRFAFTDSHCVYHSNYAFLNVGIDPDDDFAMSKMFSDNYATLRELQLGMQTFASTEDYARLGHYGDKIRKANQVLTAQLSGGR